MDATVVTGRPTVILDTLGRRVMPRRFRPVAEKRRIAQEAMQPGVSVAEIARRHGINANLVFTWRRLEQQGLLGRRARAESMAMVAVEVTPAPDTPVGSPSAPAAMPSGSVRIEFAGGVQLHVSGTVDGVLLEQLIGILRG
jgi:transposase